ncbi:MAG: hypothetical protein WC346_13140 [Methanogenium sp.]|jgi:hypothetical protein
MKYGTVYDRDQSIQARFGTIPPMSIISQDLQSIQVMCSNMQSELNVIQANPRALMRDITHMQESLTEIQTILAQQLNDIDGISDTSRRSQKENPWRRATPTVWGRREQEPVWQREKPQVWR